MNQEDSLDRATEILADSAADTPSPPSIEALGEQVIGVLHTIYDPEIPVDIFELGLVYRVDIDDDRRVAIDMTLTSPACPVAEILPEEVKIKVEGVPGVAGAAVNIVWDPPWDPSLMTEEAKLELGMMY